MRTGQHRGMLGLPIQALLPQLLMADGAARVPLLNRLNRMAGHIPQLGPHLEICFCVSGWRIPDYLPRHHGSSSYARCAIETNTQDTFRVPQEEVDSRAYL
jgi:hypothetical protein